MDHPDFALIAPERLRIDTVGALKAAWSIPLEAAPACGCLNLESLVEVDGAGLQLLAAFQAACRARSIALEVRPPATAIPILGRLALAVEQLDQPGEDA